MPVRNVVFDLGAVLIDWDPRYLYRELIDSEEKVEEFLATVCTGEWNRQLDLGKPGEVAVAELSAKFPEKAALISAYWKRWPEMLGGPIHESVDLLMELKARGTPLYALSNWHHETFAVALREFPFLRLFDGKIISGEVGMAKPDRRIYDLLLETYRLDPRETLFVDDRKENVQAAWEVGMNAVQFTSPWQLERDLIGYGLIPDDTRESGHEDDLDEDDSGCEGRKGGCGCCHH